MPGSKLFNLGLNQKHFGGNNKIAGVSITPTGKKNETNFL